MMTRKGFQHLDDFVQDRMAATRTPGFCAAFFDKQQVVRVATYGFADLEAQTPVVPETLFEIGSITKSFTAVSVMRAVEEGLVDLRLPVTDYLSWFDIQTKYEPITLHHLLTHTAGLIGVIDRTPDIRSAVWALRETEVGWPPGTRFAYSDAGYQTLTLVLEAVYKKTFAEIIRSKIFDPLGMDSSEPVLTHDIRPRLARGYQYLYDDRPYHVSHPLVPTTWIETSSGDCSIASTAEDMAKFGQMLLNRGKGLEERILSPKSYELMVHPHISAGWCEYGYGLMIQNHDGFTQVGHGGEMPGYVAEVLIEPDNEIGLALLSTTPRLSGLFQQMMSYWQTLHVGQPVEAIELMHPNPFVVENAEDYVGIYCSETNEITVTAENERLFFLHDGSQIMLEHRSPDSFYVNHTDFNRFLLRFGRQESSDNDLGQVVEAMYGAEWYPKSTYTDLRAFEYPAEWNAYPGHYRSHIPWQTQ